MPSCNRALQDPHHEIFLLGTGDATKTTFDPFPPHFIFGKSCCNLFQNAPLPWKFPKKIIHFGCVTCPYVTLFETPSIYIFQWVRKWKICLSQVYFVVIADFNPQLEPQWLERRSSGVVGQFSFHFQLSRPNISRLSSAAGPKKMRTPATETLRTSGIISAAKIVETYS